MWIWISTIHTAKQGLFFRPAAAGGGAPCRQVYNATLEMGPLGCRHTAALLSAASALLLLAVDAEPEDSLECQPFAAHPTWPLFHTMQEVVRNNSGGSVRLEPGGINDANAIFKLGQYYHIMHQDHSNDSI